MSITTPLRSSASARNAASITNVAPCSAWAGPNISPVNEWAIITWSRTSTAYIGTSIGWRIVDALAQDEALGRENLTYAQRQLYERDRRRDEHIEPRVGEQLERGCEPPLMCPARPVRRRHLPDLARDQLEAAAVEGAAERRRDIAGAVPAHFQDGGLVTGEVERGRKPGGAAARMDDEVAVAWRRLGRREADAEGGRKARPLGSDVDERHLGARQAAGEPCHQRADHAAAHPRDPVGRPGRCVPYGGEGGLHVGGEHRALRRHVVRNRDDRRGWQREACLMRMQHKDDAVLQVRRPLLDPA